MNKTKTQQFSKFFLKDLRTKEKIDTKENYLEKSNVPSWKFSFLDNWQILELCILLFSKTTQ